MNRLSLAGYYSFRKNPGVALMAYIQFTGSCFAGIVACAML